MPTDCYGVQRQLLLTPEAKSFLESEYTESVRELAHDICRALDGREKKDGSILLTDTPFLLFIIEPEQVGQSDRIVVWHGPTDGMFYNETILSRTLCSGTALF